MVRSIKILAATTLTATVLSGCTGKTVPDWAKYRPEPARKHVRIAALSPPAVKVWSKPVALEEPDPEMFTPEWYARERARDEALKRKFNICNGC
jgi:hypothetical protein